MPLTDTNQPPSEAPEAVTFPMFDHGNAMVRVRVSREALQALAGAAEHIRALFDMCRAQVGAIASDKYDRGALEPDGTVIVRTTDVAAWRQ